jgi:hypothetical protein
MRNKFAIAFCCLLLVAAIPVAADQWDKKTTVTFSQPFEIPGMALPPGTYVFKLLNSSSDRHIVLVYNEAEDHLYKIILAINNYRLNPTSDSVFKFGEERANGAPQVLRAWFWPGDNFGQEFVYPKAKARELAETAEVPVLSTEAKPTEEPEELIEAPVAPVAPEETKEVEIAAAAPPAPEPAAAAPEPEPAPAPAPVSVEELPKTASPMPLIGLLGVSSLALGGLLRRLPRRAR